MSLGIAVNTEELVFSYRKAKADLFYSSRACRLQLADFERNLSTNIQQIKTDLESGIAPAIGKDNWTLQPKSIKPAEGVELPSNNLISSDPSQEWERLTTDGNQPRVEFRLMEKLPIAFHVFATLWIMRKTGQPMNLRKRPNGSSNAWKNGTKKFHRLEKMDTAGTIPSDMGLILISSQPAFVWGGKCKSLFDNTFLFHRNPHLWVEWEIECPDRKSYLNLNKRDGS